MNDNVNHPAHYNTGKYESIDVMIETQGAEAVKNFCICNAFKYIYRHKNKNGLEDVKKAIWYLNKYVELEESNETKAMAIDALNVDYKTGPQTCETCKFEWFEPECDSCSDTYSNWQPKDEPQLTAKCLNCINGGSYKCSKCDGEMYFKNEPQTESLEYHTDTTHFGKEKGKSIITNRVEDELQTERHLPDYSYEADLGRRIMEQTGIRKDGTWVEVIKDKSYGKEQINEREK